ncbi:flagellar assembly protein FliX [Enterovirga aerilata]|uniref:Flagellar assembly protein fliX n=1 Tax=Enterovirga aerilata TaxID=2730920 RepID=A0A849IF13_9HYPH|nr:flagellar assembly protein FliX [Enterovirga sp. DB1703]NNM74700.1 flagellar assembly protein fliX [Enterovirga sp. DB1703]
MRIDPRFAAAAYAPASRPREAGGTRFSLDGKAAATTSAAGAAAPLATLDAILQLQSEEDPAERRRRSARRGRELLDGLDRLKASLLAGSVPAADLGRIAGSLAGAGPSGDPILDDLVAQIELRAKVELAKLGRADLV